MPLSCAFSPISGIGGDVKREVTLLDEFLVPTLRLWDDAKAGEVCESGPSLCGGGGMGCPRDAAAGGESAG